MARPESGAHPEPEPAVIDKLIHEPARLLIMAYLSVVESADFLFIMNETGLTFGNLSSHMSKLEATGYVEVQKKYIGKKPNTVLKLTNEGRRAFDVYRNQMKRVLGT